MIKICVFCSVQEPNIASRGPAGAPQPAAPYEAAEPVKKEGAFSFYH
jgi:hypothetical protein